MVLVAITLCSNPNIHDKRLEDFLIDKDAVNGLFDAFTAFFILTGAAAKKVVCVDPKSATELEARDIYIAGDSLGLGILLLLLGDAAGECLEIGKARAATGALKVQSNVVVCREVGDLGSKVKGAEDAGVDIMYCPVQADAPALSDTGMLIKPLSLITKDDISDFWMKVA